MRKILIAVILCIAGAVTLAGCDGCHDHSQHQH